MGRLLEKLEFYFILLVTPIIFGFQMIILFPKLVKIVNTGPIEQYVHICLSSFCLVNICGNMIMSSAADLHIIINDVLTGDRFYCDVCQMWRPKDCLHCRKCNACILRRDHHCGFLANCIGQYNRRYYILFLGHVAIAMMYATSYNYCLIVSQRPEDLGAIVYIARILNPVIWLLVPEPVGKKDIYTVYIFLNLGIGIWAGYLFYWHMKNSAMGVTAYESKYKPELKDLKQWKNNLLRVFGEKWYLAIIWPFCSSPLPSAIKTE